MSEPTPPPKKLKYPHHVHISVYCSDKFRDAVSKAAKTRGFSVSTIIKALLMDWLGKKSEPNITKND